MAPVSRPIVSILSACLNARSRASCAATSSAVIRPPLYAAAWAASSGPDPCHARRKSFKQHPAGTRPLPVLRAVASSPHTLTEAPTYARLRTSQIDRATSSHPAPDERRPTGGLVIMLRRAGGRAGGGVANRPEPAAGTDGFALALLDACFERVRRVESLTPSARAHLLADLAVVEDAIEGALDAA